MEMRQDEGSIIFPSLASPPSEPRSVAGFQADATSATH